MKSLPILEANVAALWHFSKTDVLVGKSKKTERRQDLFRAMLLNYLEHQPVNIFFRNEADELQGIECSVIAVSDEHVLLKSGVFIPVKSIVSLELL